MCWNNDIKMAILFSGWNKKANSEFVSTEELTSVVSHDEHHAERTFEVFKADSFLTHRHHNINPVFSSPSTFQTFLKRYNFCGSKFLIHSSLLVWSWSVDDHDLYILLLQLKIVLQILSPRCWMSSQLNGFKCAVCESAASSKATTCTVPCWISLFSVNTKYCSTKCTTTAVCHYNLYSKRLEWCVEHE